MYNKRFVTTSVFLSEYAELPTSKNNILQSRKYSAGHTNSKKGIAKLLPLQGFKCNI